MGLKSFEGFCPGFVEGGADRPDVPSPTVGLLRVGGAVLGPPAVEPPAVEPPAVEPLAPMASRIWFVAESTKLFVASLKL